MIRPISFTGKAYFLDSAAKALTDEQRQRIETYANKKGKYIDVVVLGAQKEDSYEYGGKKYAKKDISLDLDNGIQYKIKTQDGIKKVDPEEVKITSKPTSVFNAYIIYAANKENINLPPDKKEFDFTGASESTIIDHHGRHVPDIDF